MTNKIEIKILDSNVEVPAKATDGSAGFDLQAAIAEPWVLLAGESKLIPTGLAIHIDKKEYVGFILPRSKLGSKIGLVIGNLVGVVDSDYTGQWYISAWNRNLNDFITIKPYEKIAQAVFLKLADVDFQVVEEFQTQTERNDGGISKVVDTIIDNSKVVTEDFCCYKCGSSRFIALNDKSGFVCSHCDEFYPEVGEYK